MGRTYSPHSGREVKRDTIEDVVTGANSFPAGTHVLLMAPMHLPAGRSIREHLDILQQQGYARVFDAVEVQRIEDLLLAPTHRKGPWHLVIDRIAVDPGNEDTESRVADGAETAFFEGQG